MLFLLFGLALAERFEPYTVACIQLAAQQREWPCAGMQDAQLQQCLCEIQEYRELTFECLKLANVSGQYSICPSVPFTPNTTQALTIGLDEWMYTQVKDKVQLVTAQQSLDATTINRRRADLYSNGIFIYWLALMLVFGALNMLLWLMPEMYARVANIRVFKVCRRYLQFGRQWLGLAALEYTILLGFLALNLSFLFSRIPLVTGHVSLPTDHAQRLKHIADRASYCAAKMMPLVIFFGGRNSCLMTLTGWNIKRYNLFHKWIGRQMLFNLIIHGCCYASIKISAHTLGQAMKTSTFQFGTATLCLMALMFLQSLRYMRKNYHELFICVHVVLWLSVFAMGYCHVRKMHFGRQVFWASIGLWAIDYAMRVLKMSINGGFTKAIVTVHDNKVVEVAVPLEGREDHCGTFAFVSFVNLQWWQSHPFSYFCDGDYMRFFITPRNGITSQVNRLAQYRTPQVLVDGPYGTRPNLEMFDTLVFIVGGIGVTSVIGHIRVILRNNPDKRVHLHWAVKGAAYLELVDYLLQTLPGNVMVSVYMSTTKQLSSIESINNSVSSFGVKSYQSELLYCLVKSRLCVREIVQSHIYEGSKEGPIAVIVCGPPTMATEASEAIYDSMMESPQFIEMYNHNFGW